ncbi:Transcription elongation factor spt6 [Lobulomyces angularis]|nr:Transcription elongation factor spt6 [Lobulomyces angularis]
MSDIEEEIQRKSDDSGDEGEDVNKDNDNKVIFDSSEEDEDDEGELSESDLKFIADDDDEDNRKRRKKKQKRRSSENEEESEKEGDVENDDDESVEKKRRHKKKRRIMEEEDDLDDEDLELIGENTGIEQIEKKKFKRLKKKSDREETRESTSFNGSERNNHSNDLNNIFDDDEMDAGDNRGTEFDNDDDLHSSRRDVRSQKELFNMSEDDDDLDDFVIDDEEESGDEETKRQRREERKKIKMKERKLVKNMGMNLGISDEAWRDIEEIFGDGSDYSWAMNVGMDNLRIDEPINFDDADPYLHETKKDIKLSDLYEPSEIKSKMLTDADEAIRLRDIPERFQLVGDTMEKDEINDKDIQEEAEYITRIIYREFPGGALPDAKVVEKSVKTVLKLFKTHYEVPFIHTQRKDHINEVDWNQNGKVYEILDRSRLWRVYDLMLQFEAIKKKRTLVSEMILKLFTTMEDTSFNVDSKDIVLNFKQYLRSATTLEEINDVYVSLQSKFGDAVNDLELKKSEDSNSGKKIFKRPARRKIHEDAKRCNLSGLANLYGINTNDFISALCLKSVDLHIPVDPEQDPLVVAENFKHRAYPTPILALEGARHIIAHEISSDPKMRSYVRKIFDSDSDITIVPTNKGVAEIGPNHPYYAFKYLKAKPNYKFKDEQFLQILKAEEEGFVQVEVKISPQFVDECVKCITNDSFNQIARHWNDERKQVVDLVLNQFLFPGIVKGLKEKMAQKASDYVIESCIKNLMQDIDMTGHDIDNRRNRENIMAVSWGDGEKTSPTFAVVVDRFGKFVDYIKLDRMQDSRMEVKEGDLETLQNFHRQHKVDLVLVSGWSTNTKSRLFMEMERAFGNSVEMIDDQVARIIMNSKSSLSEFNSMDVDRDHVSMVAYCVSLCRRGLDPTMEFASLMNSNDDYKLLKLHPSQKMVPEEKLKLAIERAFINVVNSCGVDINAAAAHKHKAHTLKFICGLGPRKAQGILNIIHRKLSGRIESRAQLIEKGCCATSIFMNCSSFIRIRSIHFQGRRDAQILDLLDDTRIHPEDYDLARKMAADSIEVDEDDDAVADDPSAHVQQMIDNQEEYKLDELDIRNFAEELMTSLNEPKYLCLLEIKAELKEFYRERRRRHCPPTDEKIFYMLTGETETSLHLGLVTACRITRVLEKMVKVAFGSGSGIEGVIFVNNLVDNGRVGQTCEDHGFKEDDVIKCKVIKIDFNMMQVELTCRPSEVENNLFESSIRKDEYFSEEAEKNDIKDREALTRKVQAKKIRKVNHPDFYNIDYRKAEEMMKDKPVGFYILRPSTKGINHLSVTWKVLDGICQHVDIVDFEENGVKGFMVNDQKFSELDELLIHYIEPMSRNVREITENIKFQKNKNLEETKAYIREQTKLIKRTVYGLIPVENRPGKFYFVYQHYGGNPIPKYEPISVRSEGFFFREKLFKRLEDLIVGFKKMEIEKAKNSQKSSTQQSRSGNERRAVDRASNPAGGYQSHHSSSSYNPPISSRR